MKQILQHKKAYEIQQTRMVSGVRGYNSGPGQILETTKNILPVPLQSNFKNVEAIYHQTLKRHVTADLELLRALKATFLFTQNYHQNANEKDKKSIEAALIYLIASQGEPEVAKQVTLDPQALMSWVIAQIDVEINRIFLIE